MNSLVMLGLIAGAVAYLIDMIMKPEKHLIGLVVLSLFFGIFGAFYDTTGAKADYDRKKRG